MLIDLIHGESYLIIEECSFEWCLFGFKLTCILFGERCYGGLPKTRGLQVVPLFLIELRNNQMKTSISTLMTKRWRNWSHARFGFWRRPPTPYWLWPPRVLPTIPRVLILPQIIYRCLMIPGTPGWVLTLINEPYLRGAGFPGDTMVMSSCEKGFPPPWRGASVWSGEIPSPCSNPSSLRTV